MNKNGPIGLVIAGLAFLTSPLAFAASDAQDFAGKVAVANEFEIESSRLALEKSQNKDIQRFAQHVIDDHMQAGKEFHVALKTSQVEPPKDELDAKHQELMTKLQGLSKDDFNNQYIAVQTDAHKEAVSLFSDYSKSGDDASLKDFASKTLPTLQDHLKMVKELKSKAE